MELISKEMPDCANLTVAQLLIVAWYRSLDDMEKASLDLIICALQERHERLDSFEAHAILDNIQQGQLLAA